MEKPNVRFHDGQILSEEPLNRAMEAVDYAVEEANKVPEAVTAASSAAESASATAASAAAIQAALEEIKGSGDIPAATIAQVAENTAGISQLVLKTGADVNYNYTNSDCTEDGYIKNNGTQQSTISWKCSNYKIIKGVSSIILTSTNNSGGCIAFYSDQSESGFINSFEQGASHNMESINVPDGALYMRFCYKVTDGNINISATGKIDGTLVEDINKVSGVIQRRFGNYEFIDLVNSNCPNNGYINENGILKETVAWKSSNYESVSNNKTIKVTSIGNSGAYLCFYTATYDPILPCIELVNSGNKYINVPSSAKYVRFCYKVAGGSILVSIVRWNDDGGEDSRLQFLEDNSTRPYGHYLMNKPFNFAGKSVIFFGDSITQGVSSDDSGNLTEKFAKVFSDKMGLSFNNLSHRTYSNGDNWAISGEPFVPSMSSTPNDSITRQVLSCDLVKDVYVIAGGVNDLQLGSPIGNYGDDDETTIYGCLSLICNHLKSIAPNSTIIFVTPINICRRYFRGNKLNCVDLYPIRDAIYEVAVENDCNVVDGSQLGFPNDSSTENSRTIFLADGIHPTKLGHKMYGIKLAEICN